MLVPTVMQKRNVFNAVFGKVRRVASPDAVDQLVKTKCLPVMYYAIEVS